MTVVLIIERLHFFELVDRFLNRECLTRSVRNQLCDLVGLEGCKLQCTPHVLDDRTALHGPEGDDLADCVRSVLLTGVLDDLAASLIAEVDVDIRHRNPLWVQEPLEEQVEGERVEVRDAERIRDERARCRATARPNGDIVFSRPADEILSDQKVSGIPRALDDLHLIVEAFLGFLRQGIAVALLCPFHGEVFEEVVLV